MKKSEKLKSRIKIKFKYFILAHMLTLFFVLVPIASAEGNFFDFSPENAYSEPFSKLIEFLNGKKNELEKNIAKGSDFPKTEKTRSQNRKPESNDNHVQRYLETISAEFLPSLSAGPAVSSLMSAVSESVKEIAVNKPRQYIETFFCAAKDFVFPGTCRNKFESQKESSDGSVPQASENGAGEMTAINLKQQYEEAINEASALSQKFTLLQNEMEKIKASGMIVRQPVIEQRTVEKIISGLSQNDLDSGLSSLKTELDNLNTSLTNQINNLSSNTSRQTASAFQAISLTNRIDNLSGTRLTNITVNGVSGLTDADIPDGITASNYLPLTGGIISGNLTVNGNATLGVVTLQNATAGYFTATSTTASTFPYASTTALTVSGSAYLGSLNGPLQANNGLVSATTSVGAIYGGTGINSSALTGLAQIVAGTWSASSTLSTAFGGTGWGNLQANTVLLGNGAGRLATTSAGADGYVLGLSAGAPTWLATSTLATITGTLSVAKGGTGQISFGQGWLHSDGTTFTSSTSPTVNYLTATSTTASTFPYASTTALTVSGSAYLGSLNGPLQANNGLVSATTSVGAIYGGTGINSSALTGLAQIVAGTWSASSTLSTAFGGTGWGNLQANTVLLGNGAGRLATTSAGADGYVLGLSAGVPTWLATSTLATITGTLSVAKGGTGQTSFGQGWLHSDGTIFTSSTSPTVNYLTATSTTASTFPYASTTALTVSGTGYFGAISNTGGYTQSGTSANTFTGTPTFSNATYSALFTGGNVGIGTASPGYKLDVAGDMNISAESILRYNGAIFSQASTTLNNYFTGGAGNLTMTGTYNTANGYAALYSNTTGYRNTANGTQALFSNTTGFYNTANGMNSLFSNTTGFYNTANGYAALSSNTTGYYNTANGLNSLFSNTTGYRNTANGMDAGRYITDGSTANQTSNTSLYLGNETKALADGDSNEIVIGHNATGVGSNSAVLGNDSITKTILKGNVGIGTAAPTTKLNVAGGVQVSGTGYPTAGAGLEMSGGVAPYIQAYNRDTTAYLPFNIYGSTFAFNPSVSGVFHITNGGNVGIGTASPNNKLDIYSTTKSAIGFSGASGDTYKWTMGMNVSNGGIFSIASSTALGTTDRLVIDGNGNVGIGTAAPFNKLSVSYSYNEGSPTPQYIYNGDDAATLEVPYGAYMLGSSGGSTQAFFGNFKFHPLTLSSSYAPYTVHSGVDFNGAMTIFYNNAGLTSGSTFTPTERMRIDSSGNVGIGTTSPWRTLSVTGTVGFDGLTTATGSGSLCLTSTTNKEVVYNAADTCLPSLRSTKHDINSLDLSGIDIVKALQPVSFVYNKEYGDDRVRYGFIAEDTASVNAQLASYNGTVLSGIDDRAILSVAVKAIQELNLKVGDLQANISVSSGTGTDGLFSWILGKFKVFGLTFEYDSLKVKNVEAEKVKASDFEMKDKGTGEIYCVNILNGEWNKVKGACGETSLSSSSVSLPSSSAASSSPSAQSSLPVDESSSSASSTSLISSESSQSSFSSSSAASSSPSAQSSLPVDESSSSASSTSLISSESSQSSFSSENGIN